MNGDWADGNTGYTAPHMVVVGRLPVPAQKLPACRLILQHCNTVST